MLVQIWLALGVRIRLCFGVIAMLLPELATHAQAQTEEQFQPEICGSNTVSVDVATMLEQSGKSVLELETHRRRTSVFSGKQAGKSGAGSGAISGQRGYGAAVLISDQGLVLTNYHVIADAVTISARHNGQSWPARVLAFDVVMDLALLEIDGTQGLRPIAFAHEPSRIGDTVFAIGNPFGEGQTVTRGMISALNRTYDGRDPKTYIQHDADLNWGNSGGALLNESGCLIGINTAIHTSSGLASGFSLAIPAETALAAIRDFVSLGYIDRSYIGVSVQAMTEEMRDIFAVPHGLVVTSVDRGSPAQNAGLMSGDVLLSVDGMILREPRDLASRLAEIPAQGKVHLLWTRGGRQMQWDMETLGAPSVTARSVELGIPEGRPLQTRGAKPEFGLALANGTEGLQVETVETDSLAQQAGIRVGDLIRGLDGVAPEDALEFGRQTERSVRQCRSFALLIERTGDRAQYVVVHPCRKRQAQDRVPRGLGSAAGPY
jgi:serine protease Do